MIALIREIKQHVSPEQKPDIKLTNPSLLSELREIYLSADNVVLNALIKEVYVKAGPEWQLEPEESLHKETTVSKKMYRGHAVIDENPSKNTAATNKPKKVRMYRGHPVVD